MPTDSPLLLKEYPSHLKFSRDEITRSATAPIIRVTEDGTAHGNTMYQPDQWESDPFAVSAPLISDLEKAAIGRLYGQGKRALLRDGLPKQATKYYQLFNLRHKKTRAQAETFIRMAAKAAITGGIDEATDQFDSYSAGIEAMNANIDFANDMAHGFSQAIMDNIMDQPYDLCGSLTDPTVPYSVPPFALTNMAERLGDLNLNHVPNTVTDWIGLEPSTLTSIGYGASSFAAQSTLPDIISLISENRSSKDCNSLAENFKKQAAVYPTIADQTRFTFQQTDEKLRTLLGEDGRITYLDSRKAVDDAIPPYLHELAELNHNMKCYRHWGREHWQRYYLFASRRDFKNAALRTNLYDRSRDLLAPTVREYAYIAIAYNNAMQSKVFVAKNNHASSSNKNSQSIGEQPFMRVGNVVSFGASPSTSQHVRKTGIHGMDDLKNETSDEEAS